MSRRPQTCVDCAKRKIRCNKVIPCDVCEKRGTAHTCRRADVTDAINKQRSRKSNSPGFTDLQSPAPVGSTVEPLINERLLSLVTTLSDRVQRLEAKLDGSQTPKPSGPEGFIAPSYQDVTSSSSLERPAKRARTNPEEELRSPALGQINRVEEDDSGSGHNASDAEVEDAAIVLEFLAWGRLKDSNLTSGIREPPNHHDSAARPDVNVIQGVQAWGTSPSSIPGVNVALENLHVAQIQDLLPSKMQVFLLFEYHADWLLFMHCSFHVPTFKKELDQFYDDDQGVINMTSTGLQWAALLFAIICGSMACVPPHQIQDWGFQEDEQSVLSRRWYQASIECLNAARYQQYHNIYSLQTIASSTISAHILGFSNSQSVLLASAIRIAQSLGHHRLSSKRQAIQFETTSDIVQKELGRRLWQQLATQDWFSVPFSETYCINPLHFTTKPPMHCDEETMQGLPISKPSITTYGNFLYRVASLMPALQDRLSEAHTLEAKYEQVLVFDKMMRELVMTQLPSCLNSQTQVDPLWPSWVSVARRCLTITSAHKIIMIHRRFLGMSFRDQRYSFTRRTCLAAAKTIINEMKQEVRDKSPILWTTQAFSVAAGIILCLDNFNRHQSAREYEDHRRMVSDAITVLSQSVAVSSIAARGTRLLSDLLNEQEKHTQNLNSASSRNEEHYTGDASQRSLNVTAFVKKFCESDAPTSGGSPIATSHMPLWLQQEDSSQSYQRSRGNMTSEEMLPSFNQRGSLTNPGPRIPPQSFESLESTNRRQDPAIAPFFQHLSDSLDFRSLNWFDDLMSLAPSNSI